MSSIGRRRKEQRRAHIIEMLNQQLADEDQKKEKIAHPHSVTVRDAEQKIAEVVNHPQHYGGDTTYEAIKVIEAWELDFCLGNTVKYISRAGKKNPSKELEDLKKAQWYLARRIGQLENVKSDLPTVSDPRPH